MKDVLVTLALGAGFLVAFVVLFGAMTFPLWFYDVRDLVYRLLEYRYRMKGK